MNATLPQPDTTTYVPPMTAQPNAARAADQQLVRPTDGRRIGGVCASLADKYGWSRTTVRLLAVLSIFLPGPQVFGYLVAWIVIPDQADV